VVTLPACRYQCPLLALLRPTNQHRAMTADEG
jgi:hypothetical protein